MPIIFTRNFKNSCSNPPITKLALLLSCKSRCARMFIDLSLRCQVTCKEACYLFTQAQQCLCCKSSLEYPVFDIQISPKVTITIDYIFFLSFTQSSSTLEPVTE